MKSTIQNIVKSILLVTLYFSLNTAFAQAPQKFSYQTVVRNASNALVANANVGIKISILQGSATGTSVYSESHTTATNVNGLATIQIGGGSVLSGNFTTINWSTATYFIKTEVDPAGGTAYSISGTSQLLSVPYALSSADNKWTNVGANIYNNNTGNTGIGILNPNYKLHIGNSQNTLRIEGPTSIGGISLSMGGNGKIEVDAPGTSGGRFNIQENGNVGIGITNPTAPLTFPPTLTKKITLYPGSTGDAGFGMAGNRLKIYSDNPNADVAIGYDAAGTFNEKFAVKPNGALAVNGNTGVIGSVLVSNGDTGSANWQSISQVLPIIYRTGQSDYINTNNTTANFPSTTNMVISVTQPTRIIFQIHTYVYATCSVGTCKPVWTFEILKDGTSLGPERLFTNSSPNRYSESRGLGPFVADVPSGTYTFSFRGGVGDVGSVGGGTFMNINATAMLYPLQ